MAKATGIGDCVQVKRFDMRATLVVVLGLSFSPRAAAGDEEARSPSCGRDAAYLVLLVLGVDSDSSAIDEELGFREIVALAEVRDVLERRGLSCRSFECDAEALRRLPRLFRGKDRLAIVGLPQIDRSPGHFVVATRFAAGGVQLLDPTTGAGLSLAPDRLPTGYTVPVLFVARTASELPNPSELVDPTAEALAALSTPWPASVAASLGLLCLGLRCIRITLPTMSCVGLSRAILWIAAPRVVGPGESAHVRIALSVDQLGDATNLLRIVPVGDDAQSVVVRIRHRGLRGPHLVPSATHVGIVPWGAPAQVGSLSIPLYRRLDAEACAPAVVGDE